MTGSRGEDADIVRVELAVAFLRNPDLDERPWTETADEVVTDLVGRLDYAGVNQTLAECGNLLLTTTATDATGGKNSSAIGWLER